MRCSKRRKDELDDKNIREASEREVEENTRAEPERLEHLEI